MICSQCGNSLAEGAADCPRCGTPVAGAAAQGYGQGTAGYGQGTAGYGQGPVQYGQGAPRGHSQGGYRPARSAGGGTRAAPPAFRFDAGRWSPAERITGVASLLLLISLFLPWFSVSASFAGFHESAHGSGMDAHGYLWIVFILCLAIIALLVLQAGFETLPFQLPVAPQMLLLAATGLNLLLVLIGFFVKPGNGGFSGISVTWSFGAFIALIAAIAAVVPLVLPMARARTAS